MERIYHTVVIKEGMTDDALATAQKNLTAGLSGQPEGYDWRLAALLPSQYVDGVLLAVFEGSPNEGKANE